MSTARHTGFTIVEVMLFLGITGLIMGFMLTGMGTQLNQRRYQDATNSLVSYIQGEYSQVANVNNSRAELDANIASCTTNGNVAGTSDCAIVGRVLHAGLVDGGDTESIRSSWVVSTVDVAKLNSGSSSEAILQDSQLTTLSGEDTYALQWGTRLVRPTAQPATFTMLIVRVPTTGLLRTYVNTALDMQPSQIVSATDNIDTDFNLCVDPSGLLGGVTEPAGARVIHNATSSSGVSFMNQGECV
jgi:type II secretory pathway pseudopilin PulG